MLPQAGTTGTDYACAWLKNPSLFHEPAVISIKSRLFSQDAVLACLHASRCKTFFKSGEVFIHACQWPSGSLV